MTHRILSPLKSIALFAAFRVGMRKAKRDTQITPKPVRWTPELNQVSDEWLFGAVDTPIHKEATLYAREMGRTSSSLSQLRALLTQIVPHAPVVDAMPMAAPFGPLESDDLLFDGEAMSPVYGALPQEDADLFEDCSPQYALRDADETFKRVA